VGVDASNEHEVAEATSEEVPVPEGMDELYVVSAEPGEDQIQESNADAEPQVEGELAADEPGEDAQDTDSPDEDEEPEGRDDADESVDEDPEPAEQAPDDASVEAEDDTEVDDDDDDSSESPEAEAGSEDVESEVEAPKKREKNKEEWYSDDSAADLLAEVLSDIATQANEEMDRMKQSIAKKDATLELEREAVEQARFDAMKERLEKEWARQRELEKKRRKIKAELSGEEYEESSASMRKPGARNLYQVTPDPSQSSQSARLDAAIRASLERAKQEDAQKKAEAIQTVAEAPEPVRAHRRPVGRLLALVAIVAACVAAAVILPKELTYTPDPTPYVAAKMQPEEDIVPVVVAQVVAPVKRIPKRQARRIVQRMACKKREGYHWKGGKCVEKGLDLGDDVFEGGL